MADIFTGRLREEIPAALEALLPALKTCHALHTLNLCDNAFGPTAAEPLEKFFESHSPLKHLYLQNNGMGPEAGARMAKALAKNSAKLETIVCGRNRLENGSVPAWIECFTAHKSSLKTIKMPQNGIRPQGIELLMHDGLAQCHNLETVDLQDNTFTAQGSVALANALPSWTKLSELAVGDCLLSARGGIAVAEALQKGSNKHLTTIRLQYNEIDAKGLKALSVAVNLGLPELKLIELNGNKFGDEDESLIKIRDLFEKRGKGEVDELDDLEEDSDDEEDEGSAASEADQEGDEEEEKEETKSSKPELSALDAAIERNLAEALGATNLAG